ncbi:MAG: hypothetical protein WCJ30_21840 [Deltaproteobacteria bacterium]
MPASNTDLASQKDFTAAWSAASKDEDLQRWSAYLAEHGVTWSPEPKDREFVEQVIRSSPARAGEFVELRLSKLANDALARAGDARRLYKRVAGEPRRSWYVLSPEQRSALESSGHRFESGMQPTLRQLATIPVTLGAYFVAQHACRAAGLDANVAWIVALVAYVFTVRVVRGRWPLQRA